MCSSQGFTRRGERKSLQGTLGLHLAAGSWKPIAVFYIDGVAATDAIIRSAASGKVERVE